MTSDQATRLEALLDDLTSGRRTLADVCKVIGGMNWPRGNGKTAFQRRLADALNDLPEQSEPGSFADVSHAYLSGRIDHRQYEAISHAAASATPKADDPGHVSPDSAAGSSK